MASTYQLRLKGDFEIVVGAKTGTPQLDWLAQVPGAGDRHFSLRRNGARLFLRDEGSSGGTYINGKRLAGRRWEELSPGDTVQVVQTTIDLSQVFDGRERMGLDTTPLQRRRGGRGAAGSGPGSGGQATLCEGLYLRARPGTFTAIMGRSGAGKSVFLNLVNGYNRADAGSILFVGEGGSVYDLHQDAGEVRDFVGYVPQAEAMIPDLTLRQSLDYRLRLKFPDMAPRVRNAYLTDTCLKLGFDRRRLDEILDTQVGSPEWPTGRGGLSGGERRRANIAHELISRPLVLILDEPTSGLSSVDADKVVRLLSELARKERIAIVATIHQPSRDSFALFTHLLLVNFGGQPLYYGPAGDAPRQLEAASGVSAAGKNPAEYVMSLLEEEPLRNRIVQMFRSRNPVFTGVPPALTDAEVQRAQATRTAGSQGAGVSPVRRRRGRRWGAGWVEWLTLVQRGFRVLRLDRKNLLLAFLQVPVLGLLILFAFGQHDRDVAVPDRVARRVHHFHEIKRPYEERGATAPTIVSLWHEASQAAREDSVRLSEAAAQRRGTIYFVLVSAAIWFGIMGASKEIVTEKHILNREIRSCVHIAPYVGAKMVLQIGVVGLQVLMLVGMVMPLLGGGWGTSLLLGLALWATSSLAAAVGLLISSWAPTYRVALTVVPLIMMPQLLFGGLMRPLVDIDPSCRAPRLLSYLTIQRWGFEPALATDEYRVGNVLKQGVVDAEEYPGGRYGDLNIIGSREISILGVFFPNTPEPGGVETAWKKHYRQPCAVLLGGSLAMVLASMFSLRRSLAV